MIKCKYIIEYSRVEQGRIEDGERVRRKLTSTLVLSRRRMYWKLLFSPVTKLIFAESLVDGDLLMMKSKSL